MFFYHKYNFVYLQAHLAPQSHTQFDFQKYINRSLEEDFKVVVGIRSVFCIIHSLEYFATLLYIV